LDDDQWSAHLAQSGRSVENGILLRETGEKNIAGGRKTPPNAGCAVCHPVEIAAWPQLVGGY